MNITLRRFVQAETYTIGRLFDDSSDLKIYTLEDKVREIFVESREDLEIPKKIPGGTAIPRGVYKILPVFFDHYNRLMPELQDVPGFTEIFQHPGATDKNTAGCQLVSKIWHGGDWLEPQWDALNELWAKYTAAWDAGEDVWITVADA